MKHRTQLILAGLFILAMSSSSCIERRDYYSELEAVCAYQSGDIDEFRDECRTALEEILPYDEASFANAPDWYRERLTEAFFALYRYPLAFPPENRILGVAPYSIPLWHIRILTEDETLNKSLFNYVLNQIQHIRYEVASPEETHSAFYRVNISLEGIMTTYDGFISSISDPLSLVGTIVHEARHGSGYYHQPCESEEEGGWDCDPELSGPEGMGVTYREVLLHGSGKTKENGQPMHMSWLQVVNVASGICSTLKDEIKTLPAELVSLLSSIECSNLSYSWVVRQEGLDR